MNTIDSPNFVVCKLCGTPYTLPEEELVGNLPHVLLCGHIFCHACLLSLELNNVIQCPDCQVECTLSEGGVHSLQVDSRIVGLIYTAKMNKMKSSHIYRMSRSRRHNKKSFNDGEDGEDMIQDGLKQEDKKQPLDIEKAVDEGLAQAAENLAQLEHIRETLQTGLITQSKREKARLIVEIDEAVSGAIQAIHKRRGALLNELANMDAHFPSSRQELVCVEGRIKALETAMQKAKQVRQFPSLESYCDLDMVVETLLAPVDIKSFDMHSIQLGTGLSCYLQQDGLNMSLKACLGFSADTPKILLEESPLSIEQYRSSNRRPSWHSSTPSEEARRGSRASSSHREPLAYQQPEQQSLRNNRSPTSNPKPKPKGGVINHSPTVYPDSLPDVIIEDIIEVEQERKLEERTPPFTGPELAGDKQRTQKKKRAQLDTTSLSRGKGALWVMVSHVVNPNHFYVRHMAENKEVAMLSKKINHLCLGDKGLFNSKDNVKTGSMILVKWKETQWRRGILTEVFQTNMEEPVTLCPVTQLVRARVFLLDYGFNKSITVPCDLTNPELFLKDLNKNLRRVDVALQAEMTRYPPQAIKCSLKDIVPVDLAKGWTAEAQFEFSRVVGSAAVEMQVHGQDGGTLLVDLKKCEKDRSLSNMPLSLSEYLVFIEVAKYMFYSPVSWRSKTALDGRRPLQYYPPVYPSVNKELNAVVTYIVNPSDFYIQLVDNMEFLLLTSKMQNCYNASDVGGGEEGLELYCPVLEQACVARFEDHWYRAQVIGHPGGRNVEVRYVDFGNKRILSVGDLRKIKNEFFSIPAMAIWCCLSDVVPQDGKETWSDACTNKFISLADQKLVTAMATGSAPRFRPLPVRLFENDLSDESQQSVNLAELLVTENLASFKNGVKPREAKTPAMNVAMWDPQVQDLLEANGEAQPSLPDPPEEPPEFQPQLVLPACLENLKVRVTHVNSPGSFYVQLIQNGPQLQRVSEMLKKVYACTVAQDVDWTEGMYCAAFINGLWERGQIRSNITSGDFVQVVRCDFGNKVKVNVNNLRPLQPSLVGCLTLECMLSDIRPAGGRSTWTATACDFISYYLTGALAVMTIKELTDERPVPVCLYCANQTGQDVSIADFLVSEGLGLKERKPRVTVLPKLEEDVADSQASEVEDSAEDKDIKLTHPLAPPSLTPHLPVPLTPHLPAPLTPHPPAPLTPTALSCSPPSDLVPPTVAPKPAPRTHISAVKVKTEMYSTPEMPHLGQIQVTVTAIGDDGLIYAMTHQAEREFEQLRKHIQHHMKALPRQRPYTWKTVQGCAVMGPDMLWYRGQVLDLIGGQIKVCDVDTGLVESIPVVHVYPMLICEDIPQLCIPCKLQSVVPIGRAWHSDAVALLKELLLNRCVEMQVMELPSDPRGCLIVQISLDGMPVSKIMCYHQHASLDHSVSAQQENPLASSIPFLDDWDIDTKDLDNMQPMLVSFSYPSLPQKGGVFQVKIKHLCTPNEVFLCPVQDELQVNGETLEDALARITMDVDSLPMLMDFPHYGVCLAEYSDGKYYRAQLMEFASSSPIKLLVQHVDFGSDDILPPSKLRQMPADLLQFPATAVKVRLAGFRPPRVSQETDLLPYCPQWSIRAVLEMIELLHGNITTSVVTQEPVLTVLLYNEAGQLVHLPLVASGLADFD